ncbi:helix-turn-helix domain-containing protein [Deinococcus aerolatus]|uniref:helix-turn-helix domain-containing protein n=1 Tax=Deinococcus aerolatus TaxID=522487 RepID=UPI003570C21A
MWSGKDMRTWVQAQFGKMVHLGCTYKFMRKAGFSLQKPRSRHVKGDKTAKAASKTRD